MTKSHLLYVLIAVALQLCATCTPPAKATFTKSEEDSNTTFEMTCGDTLAVVLESNPTTGYRWSVDTVDKAVLEEIGAEYKADEVPADIVGSGGKSILRFRAIKTGRTSLILTYRRPFEKNSTPARTFELTVIVGR